MNCDFLSKNELDESDIEAIEHLSFKADTLIHAALQRTVKALREAMHKLDDPMFMYAGGRISRFAILCRNARISDLMKELQAKKE